MSLTSVNYILFLLASVALFYLTPTRFRSHVILLASLGFYLFFSPEKLLVLMIYIWLIYLLGFALKKYEKLKLFFYLTGLVSSLALLIFFRVLTGLKAGDFTPLGLSYCVLQSISYLKQLREEKLAPVKSPVDLFAFLLFFPKLMAGPVEEPDRFLKELENASFSKTDLYRGLPLIAVGMAKKLAVAEILAPAVTVTFDLQATGSGLGSLMGIIAYSLVILFDFSGYTDIAMGSALLFGIHLTENFKNPYLSVGMLDFWKRWHISLTSWLRTNIYFSLGGSRVSKGERYLNVLTVFMLSGIWHGSSLSFLTWGLYHGLLQIIELFLLEKTGWKEKGKRLPLLLRPFAMLFTFILASIGWVLFRSADLQSAFAVLSSVFTPWKDFTASLEALNLSLTGVIFALVSILVTSFFKAILVKRDSSLFTSCLIAALSLLLALSGVILLGSSAGSSFIYFNF